VSRFAVNGLGFNLETAGEGPALLLLHGFTGSLESWRPFFDQWPGFQLVAVDLTGHGGSDAPPDAARYAIEPCVGGLTGILDSLGIEKATVLGYSLGGRIALQLALARPERVSALVLESASPGIEDAAERRARVAADEALAASIERDGVAAFVDGWQALPLFASQRRLPAERQAGLRAQRLRNDAAGLANSLRGVGAGRQAWLLPRLATFGAPALLIAGALDERYCELARRMAAALPDARVAIVAAAGHAVHFEQPAAFASTVRAFLEQWAAFVALKGA
jgi:2-succinyl-6-hydroxy-2,4-cyclohexadiene-1-carboxylate synthase